VGYRIPSEDELLAAIREALNRRPIVESQAELGTFVRRVLHEEDEAYRASDERVRQLALAEGLAEVRVETGTTDEPAREACPACGADVERVENRTLDGDTTVVGTSCPRCSYSTGRRYEVPLRYEFSRAFDDGPEHKGPF